MATQQSLQDDRDERIRFPKLRVSNGTNNYGIWAVKAAHRLITLDLWNVVGGNNTQTPVIPDLIQPRIIRGVLADGQVADMHIDRNMDEVQAALTQAGPWLELNNKALDKLLGAIPDDLFYLIKKCKSAHDAWEALRTTLQPTNSTRAHTL
jgi:hypothetical protein